MKQEIRETKKWLNTVSMIKDAFDYIHFARMGLKYYSIEVAKGYLQLAESSYRSAKRRIENGR